MRLTLLIYIILMAFTLPVTGVAFAGEGPVVVVSIRPLQLIAAQIMGDTGKPELLLEGTDSPHGYQLRPSQMKLLHKADVIFYIDENFESFLVNALQTIPEKTRRIPLADAKDMVLYQIRKGGVWGSHDHEDHEHGHEHKVHEGDNIDYHLWLDPGNAGVMAEVMARQLAVLYPGNEETYFRNLKNFRDQLGEAEVKIENRLSAVRSVPYIVFHDAYQYFEKRFHLASAGAVTVDPHVPPTMKRTKEIRERIDETGAACVFYEPQFNPRMLQTILEGTGAKSAQIDPLGVNQKSGKQLYERLLLDIAEGLASCLAAQRQQKQKT